MRDDELDALLTAVSSVEPVPGLTDRVRRRIAGPAAPRRLHTWSVLAGLPAAAAAILAIGLVWDASRTVPWPGVAAAPRPSVMPAAVARALPGEEVVVVRVARNGGPTPGGEEEDDPWPYRVPALERAAPLAFDRIARETLGSRPMEIAPLSIAGLEIDSLER